MQDLQIQLASVEHSLNLGLYTEALLQTMALVKDSPKNLQLLILQGRCHLLSKQFHDSYMVFLQAHSIDQKNLSALHGIGHALLGLGDTIAAAKYFHELDILAPDRTLGVNGLASCESQNKNWKNVVRLLSESIVRFGFSKETVKQYVIAYLRNEEYLVVEPAILQKIDFKEIDIYAEIFFSFYFFITNQNEEYINVRKPEKLLSSDLAWDHIWAIKAFFMVLKKYNYESLCQLFDSSLKHLRFDSALIDLLANAFKNESDWSRLEALSNHLIKIYPDSPDGYLLHIEALAFTGKTGRLKSQLKKILELFPSNLKVQSMIAGYGGFEDWHSQLTSLNKTRLQSTTFQLASLRLAALIKLHRFTEAIEFMEDNSLYIKKFWWFRRLYASIFDKLGKYSESVELWSLESELRPSDIFPHYSRINALVLLGNVSGAIAAYERATQLFPQHPVLAILKSKYPAMDFSFNGQPEGLISSVTMQDRFYLHSGDMGDITYALATIKKLGPGVLFLVPSNETRVPLTKKNLRFLSPLLSKLPYITDVKLWDGEHITHDFTTMRISLSKESTNLLMSQYSHVAINNDINLDDAWIEMDETVSHGRPVFSRSIRYRNPEWEALWAEIKSISSDAIFMGTKEEFLDFNFGEHVVASNAYEMAQIINGASIFVGNQSFPYSIAEAMKIPRALETSTLAPNCSFNGVLNSADLLVLLKSKSTATLPTTKS